MLFFLCQSKERLDLSCLAWKQNIRLQVSS